MSDDKKVSRLDEKRKESGRDDCPGGIGFDWTHVVSENTMETRKTKNVT